MLCPACSTQIAAGLDRCPACGNPVDRGINPFQPPTTLGMPPRLPPKVSVGLGLVLVFVLMVAFLVSPGMGLGLTLLALPAYARAVANSLRKSDAGQILTNQDRILSFLGSLGIVMACAVAGGVAFFVTCVATLLSSLAIHQGQNVEMFVIGTSALGFVVAAGIVFWAAWPRKRR